MRMSFKEQVWKFKKQHSVLFAFCTSMHPVEDNIHWISPNPNKIDVFGKKGNGISAALKTAKNYTGEIKIVNEGKWNKGKEIKERRKRKRQGSLPSKEYRTNIKEFKEEIRDCYSHLWSQTCGYMKKLNRKFIMLIIVVMFLHCLLTLHPKSHIFCSLAFRILSFYWHFSLREAFNHILQRKRIEI